MGPVPEEFSEFFLQWEPQVRRFLMWLDGDPTVIDDVAQETMIDALRSWDRLKDRDRPRGWLFKAATWRLAAVRRARQRQPVSTDPAVLPALAEPVVRDDFAALDSRLAVLEAVRKLPAQQATAIALQLQYDLPLRDIASIMDLSLGSVKTHLHHARKSLNVLLGQDEEAEL